jgi:sec-independent protein translocase protein TatB
MFNGLTFEKLLLVAVVAVFLVGPDRLPHYAAQLAKLVRTVRDFANSAKTRMKDEMGPEFDEVDWKRLDPRQYDPRRIIREALLDDTPSSVSTVAAPIPTEAPATTAVLGTAAILDTTESASLAKKSSQAAAGVGAMNAASTLALAAPAPFDSEAT